MLLRQRVSARINRNLRRSRRQRHGSSMLAITITSRQRALLVPRACTSSGFNKSVREWAHHATSATATTLLGDARTTRTFASEGGTAGWMGRPVGDDTRGRPPTSVVGAVDASVRVVQADITSADPVLKAPGFNSLKVRCFQAIGFKCQPATPTPRRALTRQASPTR